MNHSLNSSIQNAIELIEFVKSKIAKKIRRAPIPFSTFGKCLLNLATKRRNGLIKLAAKTKGKVKPVPKTSSRPTPLSAVSSKEAVNKTAANTPPTHGVQPAAKAKPTT